MQPHILQYEKLIKEDLSHVDIDSATYKEHLHKAFEWFACIQLSKLYNSIFTRWEDVPPHLREEKNMQRDMGIDAWDISGDRIAQMKLYQGCISNRHLSTFVFAANTYFKNSDKILYRNIESQISQMIKDSISNKDMLDITVADSTFRDECKRIKKKSFPDPVVPPFSSRPYQEESVRHMEEGKLTDRNVFLCAATGTGKTTTTLLYHSRHRKEKMLILVPTIILMEQWAKSCKDRKFSTYLIGTGHNKDLSKYSEEELVICVYNSFPNIEEEIEVFARYVIDEAHHVIVPEIYQHFEDSEDSNSEDSYTYLDKIRELHDTKKAIYLSAVLDEPDDDSIFYRYSIRDAILDGYLHDYEFVFPIFEQEDVTNANYAHYLVHKMRESHCLIFSYTEKDGKKFTDQLNKQRKGCAKYVDAKTSRKQLNKILQEFDEGEIQFLVNPRLLAEGYDMPSIRSIFLLNVPLNRVRAVEIIGRALRPHPQKNIAKIYMPYTSENDTERIQHFVHQICSVDEKIKTSVQQKKIGGYINVTYGYEKEHNEDADEDPDEDDSIFNHKYNIVVDSMGNSDVIKNLVNKKCESLLRYVEKDGLPKYKTKYDGFNIGEFWRSIKQGTNKGLYESTLSKNEILKKDYEKVQKIKEEKKGKKNLTPKQKCESLLRYVEKHEKYPPQGEMYDGFNICEFWSRIKQGANKGLYESTLSKNEILKKDYEKVQKIKEEKKGKKNLTPEQKCESLLRYVKKDGEKGRCPRHIEEYDGFNIGKFWNGIKQGCNKGLYESMLSKNEILKDDYERAQKIKEEKKGKKKLTPKQKCESLLKYVEKNEKCPLFEKEHDGFNIGKFWDHIKQGNYKGLYDSALSKNEILKKDYERVQKIKEEKKGKKNLTPEQKCESLLRYVEKDGEKGRCPRQIDEYDGFNIGRFWNGIKQGGHEGLYRSMLSKNEILKKDYEKVQKIKEENKKKCES